MIKLDPIKTQGTTRTSRPKKTDASTSTFQLPDEPSANEAFQVSSPSAIDVLTTLMDLQEITDKNSQRTQLQKRGATLLDELDKLRSGLLLGSFSSRHLKQLAESLAENRELFDGSQLSTVVLEIEQRVAVELAKLEMSQKKPNSCS
jgi:hypothetical protein